MRLAMHMHGHTSGGKYHPLYSTWRAMRERCLNPNYPGYEYWGGRGIAICERWDDFAAFVDDMGPRPEGHTLDRVNNDLGYFPGNCRWATPLEQTLNRRPSLTCRRGHPWTTESTYVKPEHAGGRRACRICRRERAKVSS